MLDLEREDIVKLPGMTPEAADQLMAFLTELTDGRERAGEDAAPRRVSGGSWACSASGSGPGTW